MESRRKQLDQGCKRNPKLSTFSEKYMFRQRWGWDQNLIEGGGEILLYCSERITNHKGGWVVQMYCNPLSLWVSDQTQSSYCNWLVSIDCKSSLLICQSYFFIAFRYDPSHKLMYCENFKISSSTWATHFLRMNNITLPPRAHIHKSVRWQTLLCSIFIVYILSFLQGTFWTSVWSGERIVPQGGWDIIHYC